MKTTVTARIYKPINCRECHGTGSISGFAPETGPFKCSRCKGRGFRKMIEVTEKTTKSKTQTRAKIELGVAEELRFKKGDPIAYDGRDSRGSMNQNGWYVYESELDGVVCAYFVGDLDRATLKKPALPVLLKKENVRRRSSEHKD